MGKLFNWIMALVMSLGMSGGGVPADSSQLAVHYIDVGQADAALVVCGGEAMMIDGGNKDDSSLIAAYLKEQGVDRLKYVICSHAHEDHVGGLAAALSVAEAEHVYAPKTEADTQAYKNFKKKAKEQKVKIEHPRPGDRVPLGSAEVEFIAPVKEDGEEEELNNTSIVLKITHGENSFLFTGDAEREEESDILSLNTDIRSNVLKVGHHGSNSSSTYSFLREVMPQYAVVSVGKDNSYGHPSDKVISRLEDAGVQVLRTDKSGHIVFVSDGENITYTLEKR